MEKQIENKIKVMAIGAHLDECHAGCGATLYMLSRKGCECMMLHVACHNHRHTPENLAAFEARADKAAQMLGCSHKIIGDRGNQLYEGSRADRELIMAELEAFQPNIVFLQWPQDSHPEHRSVALTSYEAILNSFWNQKLNSVREIYAYEAGPSQTMLYFMPDFYINITSVFDLAKEAYDTMFPEQKPSSLSVIREESAIFRARCASFSGKAEAFKVVKFPHGVGDSGNDLMLRRLLTDFFIWGGASPWPYASIDYTR